jgi:uncharacterized protein YjdB
MVLAMSWATLPVLGCGSGDNTVGPPASSISVVELSQRTLTLGVGSSAPLEVTVRDAAGKTLPGGAVYWSSSDATVATVSLSGVVTALKVGRATIAATIQGKSAVATVTVSPTPAAAVRLSPSELQLTVGQQGDLNATVVDANGAPLSGRVVAWKSSTASVAIVDSTGHVTAIAPGATSVTASSEGKSITAAVTVLAIAVASVRLTPTSVALVEGQSAQLTADARDASGQVLSGRTILWSSSAPSIATVSSSGQVIGVAAGSATIEATSEGRSATTVVSVAKRPVSSLVVSPSQLSLLPGQSATLSVVVTDADGAVLSGRGVSFSSASPAVATVSTNGTVTAVAAGSTTITVTSEGKTASAAVTVAPTPVASIRVAPATASIDVGSTAKVTARVLDAGGASLDRPVSWSSGAPTVASVAQDGTVTGLSVGTAVILASAEGRVGSATVTVAAVPVATVTIAPSSATLDPGGSATLVARVQSASGGDLADRAVLWSSSDTKIATVSSTGVVTAVATGVATITASADSKAGTATISVSNPAASVRVAPATVSVPMGGTATLTATVLDAAGGTLTRTVSWSSSAPAVASVSQDGTVTGNGIGAAIISASADGRVGLATVIVTAAPVATVTIAPASSTLEPGGTTTLTATVRSASGAVLTDRTVLWSSSDTRVATVSPSGVVTAIAPGTATVTASAEGKTGTASVTVSRPAAASVGRVTVTPPTAAIVWTGPSNRTVQLTATAYTSAIGGTVIPDATFAWTTSNANVATVSPTGLVTAIADGTASITARSGTVSGTAVIISAKK